MALPTETARALAPEEERRVLWLTLIVAVVLLGVLAATTYFLWPRYPECRPQGDPKCGPEPTPPARPAHAYESECEPDCKPKRTGQLVWPIDDAIVMFVPIPIIEWAFAGAMVAMLYRLAHRRGLPESRLALYTWAIAKPVIGLFMGSLVYFLALAAAKLLGGALSGALWLNVVAFVGGFSEQLSVGLIHRFVRRRLGDNAADEDGPKPPRD